MATAKQLAWRKEFAAKSKAGTLTKKRKTNPAKKTAVKRKRTPVKKIAVSAPSRATGAKPTKRLKARRAANTKPGMYPNPRNRVATDICVRYANTGRLVAKFPKTEKRAAMEYARALADKTGKQIAVE